LPGDRSKSLAGDPWFGPRYADEVKFEVVGEISAVENIASGGRFGTGGDSCENMAVATGAKSKGSQRSVSRTEASSERSFTGTKRTVSGGRKSSSRSRADTPMKKTFAVCVKNDGYKASLELRKLYEVLPDEFAAKNGLVRVIDESGEDYLYGADYFASVSLPKSVETTLRRIGRKKPAA
jgi:hypothetical protein